MYTNRDFMPADADESEPFGFDFIEDFDDGEFITGTPTFTLVVARGTDADPSSHLIGTPVVLNATQTAITIAGLLENVLYTIKCVVVTSFGRTKTLWSHIPCEAVE